MATQPPDVTIESLRGGLNDTDPPNALAYDECTIANNVEFFYSTLGERRLGGQRFDLTGSDILNDDVVVFVTRHFPTKDEIDNELWVFSAVIGNHITINRRTTGGWVTVSPPQTLSSSAPEVYEIQAVSFDQKLYICAKFVSGDDRMMIWDGTSLRLAGLGQPVAAPTAIDEGSGTFTGTRYYRIRYIEKSGSTIVRESEPSDEVTFNPSGSGAGATVTRPALLGEGETHWILEASSDHSNFYQIATIIAATTTFNDETDIAVTPYADVGELSASIGEDVPLSAARFVAVDDDRLVLGGSFIDDTLDSRVMWTPTRNADGFGNSERIPADTDNFKDLDSHEGGGLTGISQTVNGSWYAFKSYHIYTATRTGNAANAYAVLTVSKARGAIFGSIVSGMDEYGRACIYFTDTKIGPSRIGLGGLQQIQGLRNTWARVNATATQAVVRGVYYPFKQQMWWFVAVDGANAPNLGLKLQVNELREVEGGVHRGWTTFDGTLATALSATLFTEQMVDENGHNTLSTRPALGFLSPDYLLRSDLLDTDNGTAYVAKIRTRPLFQVGLLNRWGAMTAALLAAANGDAKVQVSFIRNYGLETNHIITNLAPQATEDYVIKAFDNLIMSSSIGTQIEFSDVVDPSESEGILYHSEP